MRTIRCTSCNSIIMETVIDGFIKTKCESCGTWNIFIEFKGNLYKYEIKN